MMPEQQDERTERWGIWWLASYEERGVRIMELKYSHVHVRLLGQDGNAFLILGQVSAALRKAGVPQEEIEDFLSEATSGDYDHMLQTVMRTVDTD
jgi:hypothetical protein